MTNPTPKPVSVFTAWSTALRPKSFPISICPVILGVAFSWEEGVAPDASLTLLALMAALLMQIITNLQNDVGYTARGAEQVADRTGLPRATASGWLSVHQVRVAIALLSFFAGLLGLVMTLLRGWPVLAIGTTSLIAALAYMGGPKPIAYTAFGELTAAVFFGPVAVLGTVWLLTGGISLYSTVASISIGSLAGAALAVNNHRDRLHDQRVGRHTFAVQFGENHSASLFAGLLFLAFVPVFALGIHSQSLWFALPLALIPQMLKLLEDFRACAGDFAMNPILLRTFKLTLHFTLLLAASALLTRIPGD